MQFKNILFVVDDTDIHENALNEAIRTAQTNQASVTVLALHLPFAEDMDHIEKAYKNAMQSILDKKSGEFDLKTPINLTFSTHTPHFVSIIQAVLQKEYDLVVKAAQDLKDPGKKGFKSLDMSLLRKCPCPVWLYRPFTDPKNAPVIAVCVDAFAETPEGQDLNLKLLKNAASMAGRFETGYTVLSYWTFENEDFLRNSAFGKMEESKVDAMMEENAARHKQALERIIEQAGVTAPHDIISEKGAPETMIPGYSATNKVDILVMGTVARTGLAGFFIGNTAENVIADLGCGLMAMKPGGFVSPVKAY